MTVLAKPPHREPGKIPEGPPKAPVRVTAKAAFWIWLVLSMVWCLWEGHNYGTHNYAGGWWAVLDFIFLPGLGAGAVWYYAKEVGWTGGQSTIDPLRWRREQQVALLTGFAIGWCAGMFF